MIHDLASGVDTAVEHPSVIDIDLAAFNGPLLFRNICGPSMDIVLRFEQEIALQVLVDNPLRILVLRKDDVILPVLLNEDRRILYVLDVVDQSTIGVISGVLRSFSS